mmetsp:Transcript_6885/g.14176  ORF Transcript_6885/g.14176 Transcript_6885/m.14176 type:complete len:221 (-) Transcript_6885:2301-2963(-)
MFLIKVKFIKIHRVSRSHISRTGFSRRSSLESIISNRTHALRFVRRVKCPFEPSLAFPEHLRIRLNDREVFPPICFHILSHFTFPCKSKSAIPQYWRSTQPSPSPQHLTSINAAKRASNLLQDLRVEKGGQEVVGSMLNRGVKHRQIFEKLRGTTTIDELVNEREFTSWDDLKDFSTTSTRRQMISGRPRPQANPGGRNLSRAAPAMLACPSQLPRSDPT